jgi:hypothetical protein
MGRKIFNYGKWLKEARESAGVQRVADPFLMQL